ncbi:MAG: hypothetical protein AB1665_06565 [Candidatus Thermoplasmatota archaeon]
MAGSSGATSYDRIQPGHGAGGTMSRGSEIALHLPSTYLLIWLVIAIIALPLLNYAMYSGAVRWLLSLLIISAVAVAALAAIHPKKGRVIAEMPPISIRERGAFDELVDVTRRASLGFKYSQVMLSERVADAFVEKVRIARGIPTIDALSSARDEERMRSLCGDEELARFVVRSRAAVGRPISRLRRGRRSREGQRYMKETMEILDKIESWR